MKLAKVIAVATVLAFSASAGAAELLVTQGDANAKSGQRLVSVDLATDGEVSGFNFLLKTGAIKPGSIDLRACVESLPKSFSGECRQGAEGVYFFAMASARESLPAGVIAVGKLGLPAGVEILSVEELAMGDVDGNTLNVQSQVAK
jgi:hypothetical protein